MGDVAMNNVAVPVVPAANGRSAQVNYLQSFGIEIAKALYNTVGSADSDNYFRLVGLSLGDMMFAELFESRQADECNQEMFLDILDDFTATLFDGRVEDQGDGRVVVSGCRCPLGNSVKGQASVCHVTAGMVGRLFAQVHGYARVSQPRTLAKGDCGCTTVIDLKPSDDDPGAFEEYFRSHEPS